MRISSAERREQILEMKRRKQETGYRTLVYESKYFAQEYKEEFIDWLEEPHKDDRKKLLIANAGSGKTFATVTELARKGEKIIFLTPNIATSIELSKSEDYEGVACWAKYNIFESAKNDDLANGKVIFMTYAQLPNLAKVKDIYHDYYLVVDEAHVLVNSHSINSEAISALTKMEAESGYFKNILYITATPKPLIYALGRENMNILDFRKKKNKSQNLNQFNNQFSLIVHLFSRLVV